MPRPMSEYTRRKALEAGTTALVGLVPSSFTGIGSRTSRTEQAGDNRTDGDDGDRTGGGSDDRPTGDSDGQTESGTDDTDGTDGADETALLRIVHLSPNAPLVDIYIDGELVYQDVQPYNTGVGYLNVSPGVHTVKFVPAGGDPDQAVIDTTIDLQAAAYTLAAIGEVSGCTDSLHAVLFSDDNSPVEPGTTRVRFIHASPDAPAVDVTAEETGRTLFTNVGFGDGEYVTVPAGEYTFAVQTAVEGDCHDVLIRTPFDLTGGAIYTVYLTGYLTPADEPTDKPLTTVYTRDALPSAHQEE